MGTTKMKQCVRAVCAPRHLGYALGMRRKFAMSVYVFYLPKENVHPERIAWWSPTGRAALSSKAPLAWIHTHTHTQAKKIIPKVG